MDLIADDDRTRLGRDWIWRMSSTEADWHRWRRRADVEAQIDGAWRVVGVYEAKDGRQVGFARAVSDGVHDAYLADVIIEPGSRGRGIGKLMMRTMVEDGPGSGFGGRSSPAMRTASTRSSASLRRTARRWFASSRAVAR